MENENIPTQIQNLTCDEQLELMLLIFSIAKMKSNLFIPLQQVSPLLSKLTELVVEIEDRQVKEGIINSEDRVTLPANSIEEEKLWE